MLKISKIKKIPKRACAYIGVSAIFAAFCKYEEEKKYSAVLFGNHRQKITGSLLLVKFYMAVWY